MTEERLHIDWGNDKLYRTQKHVERNPYDLESWSILLREAQIKHISEVRPLYEHIIEIFPSASRYWRIYIEHEMKSRNFEKVEKLFQRCLMKILNIELWKLYLTYVKETKASLTTYKEKMAQAYDFALDKIGMDIHSYPIWNDYVNFLKSVEAVGSYAENQKISAVRKVYQRGVINPMIGMETFWKDYISFEQAINTIIAEKMSIERSRDYMNARRVAKELEVQIRGINRNAPSVPPCGSSEEQKQVELWQKYIGWEKSNPLRTEDTALLTRRVVFALEQCLLCLGHHADIWYQAAQFLEHSCKVLQEKGDVNASKLFSEEAANMFERATSTLLSKNMLLYFAYADYEEGRVKYDKVHQIYQRYLDIKDIDPTLAYVQYMKFARRAEGIKSARNIFKRAREDSRSKYHVFVCAALMEYYCSKDKNIAFRIFELGLKKFSGHPDYISCYIDYLSHLNEDNNTRVLFERVLSSGSLEPAKSVDIWNKFLEFESNIGDLQSIVKVEKRRAEVLSKIKEFEGRETAQLVDRYRFLDLYPCLPAELKSIGMENIFFKTRRNAYRETSQQCLHINEPLGHPDFFTDADVINLWALFHKQPGHSSTASMAERKRYTEVVNITGAARNHILQQFISSDDDSVLPKPDISQMIPYKPKTNPTPGEHPVPGGTFPMPPTAAHLCTQLPPPSCFRGPFVNLDQLIDIYNRIQMPDAISMPIENGGDVRLFDLAKSVHWIVDDSHGGIMRKRKRIGLALDGSDDEDMTMPPINDIYRQRQQKRVK